VRFPAALLAALVFVIGVGGCGAEERKLPAAIVGVIVEVNGEGSDVTSFVVDTRESGHLEVFIVEDVAYGFDLNHLRQHEFTGEPVRCRLEERNGRPYALEIVDA
jgi:hypothetical protein